MMGKKLRDPIATASRSCERKNRQKMLVDNLKLS